MFLAQICLKQHISVLEHDLAKEQQGEGLGCE